jgi:GNAT superfamily N-acetyltransferase
VIDVAAASLADQDARRLLAAYIEELDRRLPEGARDFDGAWGEKEYGSLRGRVVVARLNGSAVGCAGLREHARSAAEIKRFYVAPEARGRGVGRSLLACVEGVARELGYRKVVLDTAAPLHEATHLYETSGYSPVAAFNDNPHATRWFEKVFPLDDAALWGAFRYSTLPEAEWTHRSHLRVAFLHLARWSLDEAHLRMRVGIIRLNATHGLEETAERGYHETMTRVWLALVAHTRAADAHASSEAFLAAHPDLLDKQLPLRFYSRQRLLALEARTVFVQPDVAPVPGLQISEHTLG